MHRKRYLQQAYWAGSAMAIALSALAAPAYAQQAEPAAEDEELVVTATRREERLNRVPLSITALSQESLDERGVDDIRDLAAQTPGLDVPVGRVQRISVRGIDSNAGAATSAVYIDDVPIQARNASINYSGSTVPYIFDLERVEVLRGPQGTLFGASAQGGAVRFITPTPSLSEMSAFGRVQVNAVDHGGVGSEQGFAIGGPLVEDVLGARVSFFHQETAGWIDRQSWQAPQNRQNDANTTSATVFRGALNWQAADWLSIVPSFYYQHAEQDDRGLLYTGCPATVTLDPSINPCPNGVSDPEEGAFWNYGSLAMTGEDEFYLPSLRVTADIGDLTFTSVSSYFNREVAQINDATYNNDRVSLGNAWLFPVTPGWSQSITWQAPVTTQDQYTQEFRLSNSDPDAWARWTVGVFYSTSELESNTPIASPHYPDAYQARFGIPLAAAPYMVDGIYRYYGVENTEESSTSLFGNVDIRVVDGLTLSLGGRYSWNELEFDIVERGVSYAGGIATAAGAMEEEPFTPRVALSWQIDEESMLYASYARGYRTGGVNKAVPDICAGDLAALGISGGGTYESDTTDSYEIGWKSSMLDRRLVVQTSVFQTTWDSIQQQIRLPCAFSLVANTATAVSQGIDLNVNWRATDNLTLSLAGAYTEAEYEDTIIVGVSPLVTEGQTLGQTPWTLYVAADYNFNVGEIPGYVRAQYNYRAANDGPFAYQIPGMSVYDVTRGVGNPVRQLDARLGFELNEHLTIEGFVDNITNNVDLLYTEPTYIAGPLRFGETQRPRLVGLQVYARY